MKINTTIGSTALAILACCGIGGASASPLALNSVSAATSQVQNVGYHCYRRHGRRYCNDAYEAYDDSYYDDYGYGSGVVIGVGRHHHHNHGGVHYYRGSPIGGAAGHVGRGPSGGGLRMGGGPAMSAGHAFGGAGGGLGHR